MEKTTLINILCYKLPGEVCRAVYNEYENRWKDIEYIWKNNTNKYWLLKSQEETVKLLLAMSTFYRRVLSGFDGARDFYKTLSKSDDVNAQHAIVIGKFILDDVQYRKLQAIQMSFGQLMERYCINSDFFDYFETYEFLGNCLQLYYRTITPDDGKPEELPF